MKFVFQHVEVKFPPNAPNREKRTKHPVAMAYPISVFHTSLPSILCIYAQRTSESRGWAFIVTIGNTTQSRSWSPPSVDWYSNNAGTNPLYRVE